VRVNQERRKAISTKVFVGNLNFSTTKDELTQIMSEVGQVVDVHLPTDRETGRPRGFAFVSFSNETEASEAIRLFNGREVGGRRLNVNEANDRPSRPGGSRPFRSPSPGFAAPPSGSAFEDARPGDELGRDRRPFRNTNKGSRRGLRARKRSLNF
jgi:RNA recognition motif-containing protein